MKKFHILLIALAFLVICFTDAVTATGEPAPEKYYINPEVLLQEFQKMNETLDIVKKNQEIIQQQLNELRLLQEEESIILELPKELQVRG